MSTAVVTGGNGPESLLSSSIPLKNYFVINIEDSSNKTSYIRTTYNLEFDNFVVQL